MAGKCLLWARAVSSIRNAPVVLRHACVTGSVKSPPGGDTDRIIVSEPVLPPRVSTTPALSRKPESLDARYVGYPSSPGISSREEDISLKASAHLERLSARKST